MVRPKKKSRPAPPIDLAKELEIRAFAAKLGPRNQGNVQLLAERLELPTRVVREVLLLCCGQSSLGRGLCPAWQNWYGEQLAPAGTRCPRCGAKLTITPCRACRMAMLLRRRRQ
jgi:hypothetical protein